MPDFNYFRMEEASYGEYLLHSLCEERKITSVSSFFYNLDELFTLSSTAVEGLKKEFKTLQDEVCYEAFEGSDKKSAVTLTAVFDYEPPDTKGEGIPIYIKVRSNYNVNIIIGTDNEKVFNDIVSKIQKYILPTKPPSEKTYNVNFWHNANNGPKCKTRKFEEKGLKEILDNYNAEDQKKIEVLRNYQPKKGGELLLFTGEAGVGKSNLLLALFNDWKKWATINYILDPQVLFSGSPSYVIDLVLNKKSLAASPDIPESRIDDILYDESSQEKHNKDKWNIFILEDCGEMLAVDAREKQGQALSMFLNLTDGFIGRGTRSVVIVTTNEEIDKLHPAVSRPGRCSFYHKFGKLSAEESREWLKNHGHAELTDKVTGQSTLAELYALVGGFTKNLETLKKHTKRVGFVKEDP